MSITVTKCDLYSKFKSDSINFDKNNCPRTYKVNGSTWTTVSTSGKFDGDNISAVAGTAYSSHNSENYIDIPFLYYGDEKKKFRVIAPGGFLTFEQKIGPFYCTDSYLKYSSSDSSSTKKYSITWNDEELKIGSDTYGPSYFREGVVPTRLFCFLIGGGGGGGGAYDWNDDEGGGGGGSAGWILVYLLRSKGSTLEGDLQVGAGGKGGACFTDDDYAKDACGKIGESSYIELRSPGQTSDEGARAYATPGDGGDSSYEGSAYEGAGGAAGGYGINDNGNGFMALYDGGDGYSGGSGGTKAEGSSGDFNSPSNTISATTAYCHNSSYTFNNSHPGGRSGYDGSNNVGGAGAGSILSVGGPGGCPRLRDSQFSWEYVPGSTNSSGNTGEETWYEHQRWSGRNIGTPGAGAGGGGGSTEMRKNSNWNGGDGGDGLVIFFY